MEKKHLHKPWDVLRKAANGMIELPVKVRVYGYGDPHELTIEKDKSSIEVRHPENNLRAFYMMGVSEEWELLISNEQGKHHR